MTTIEKMKKANIKQVSMIKILKTAGITVQPGELSSILNGTMTTPKARMVLNEIEKILSERTSN